MLRTEIVRHKDLPEDLKENYPDEYDYFLLVYHNNELIFHAWDGMEPEDVRFYRDLKWVPEIIEKAYKLGLKDGSKLDYLEN